MPTSILPYLLAILGFSFIYFAVCLLNNVAKVLYCGKCKKKQILIQRNSMNGNESANFYFEVVEFYNFNSKERYLFIPVCCFLNGCKLSTNSLTFVEKCFIGSSTSLPYFDRYFLKDCKAL